MKPLRFALALLPAAAITLHAQQASVGPWIPLGSSLDRLVSWVSAEGGLASVDPLTRPFRMAAVRAAVAEQDTLRLSASGRRAFAWLASELDGAADSTAVVAEVGAESYQNGRRDSFRAGGSRGNAAMGGLWLSLTRGPLVVVANPAFDNRLRDDPEYTGDTSRFIVGRMQTGYVAMTGALGDLLFGRAARNWGPELFDGLQLSPSAYATDQLVGTLRVGRFELTTIAQRIDDYDTTLSVGVSRWFLAHRLGIRAGRGIWLAFTETGVYGGPGRGIEPAFLVPVDPAMLAQVNEDRKVNLLWGAEAHVPLGSRLSVEAQGVIDDIQIDRKQLSDRRPWSGGFTLVARGALPGFPAHASLGYTQVRSLTYRNSFAPWEVYAVQGVGIARNYADYDQVLLRLETQVSRRAHMALDASYLRQGSGDFRSPFPSDSVLAGPGQGFLVAPVGHGAGVRFTISLEVWPGVWLNSESGYVQRPGGGHETITASAVRIRFDALRMRLGGAWPAVERGADRSWP